MWAKNVSKYGFLNVLQNLVIIFFRIWSVKKVYVNSSILAQIPYLGKILFLRHGPKCSQPIRLQDIKSTVTLKQNVEKARFFAY